MTCLDLKSETRFSPLTGIEAGYARREVRFLPTHGFRSLATLSNMRQSLRRRLQSRLVPVCRAIPRHGLRSIDLPSQFARSRGVSVSGEVKALSHGHSQYDLAQQPRSCQPNCTKIKRTAALGQPNATARSAKAYCRAVDSRCSSTCCWGDCRTYTIAKRCRCASVIFSERSPLVCRSCRPAAGLTVVAVATGGSPRVGRRIVVLLIGRLLAVGRSEPLSENTRQSSEQFRSLKHSFRIFAIGRQRVFGGCRKRSGAASP